MAIVTYSYYANTFLGETIAETDFPRAEKRAEALVNQITHGRAANYTALPEWQQQAIQEAICCQIEYYALNGVDVSISGVSSDGWTVGKVHVNGGGNSKAKVGAPSMVSPSCLAALELTGLLNPQVPTLGDPPIAPYWIGGV